MKNKPSKAQWEAMSEAERIAVVRDGRAGLFQIREGLEKGSEELHAACKDAVSGFIDKDTRAKFMEIGKVFELFQRAKEDLRVKLGIEGELSWLALLDALQVVLDIDDKAEWDEPFAALIHELESDSADAFIERLGQELKRSHRQRQQEPKRKRPETTPLSRNGAIRAPADRINKATIEAFMTGAMRKDMDIQVELAKLEARGLTESNQFWAAYPIETKGNDLHGAIGFTKDPGEDIWNLLQKHGALAVKAQYALWARAYAETDAEPNQFIKMPITRFCDDLGFKKKGTVKKGRAHTRENKQAAMNVLELLTSLELRAVYHPSDGTARRLRGPLWSRGIIAEEMDGYADLFGSNRVPGTKAMWDPVAFSYAPGPFFADEVWRTYNRNVALIGEGLLKLSSGYEDKYAVMVGGYLAILARMNSYQRTVVRVRLLLEKTGLWSVDGESNPGRMREKLERALDRIQEVGVIREKEITSSPENIDPNDLTSNETLDALAEPTRWTKGWLSQFVVIDWPADLERRADELQAKKAKVIAGRRGRKSRQGSSADKGGN